MNKELKIMIYTALGILVVLLISVNLATLISNDYINETTKSSQRIALNRLRRPHLNRSSELGKYPDLKKKRITLLAIRKSNRLYVINNHRVLYIVNAEINLKPSCTVINAARGEHTVHVKDNTQSMGVNWLNFGKLGYIESPVSVNTHRVHGNWIRNSHHLPNTIEVSKTDAKWLQQLPKGTKLIVR